VDPLDRILTGDLGRRDILAQLSKCPMGSQVLLSGTIIVARDIAHARFEEQMGKGSAIPRRI